MKKVHQLFDFRGRGDRFQLIVVMASVGDGMSLFVSGFYLASLPPQFPKQL
jgi:acyl CoA:acetate/3-ketoacid CoA transferase alpha subunit